MIRVQKEEKKRKKSEVKFIGADLKVEIDVIVGTPRMDVSSKHTAHFLSDPYNNTLVRINYLLSMLK